MNTRKESLFASIVRKLNDRGVTLHREGGVEYPDGTVVFKDDAALLYTDGEVEYRVVKTRHGYVVWNGAVCVAAGGDEYDVDVLVDDIYRAVVGTSTYTLADWRQEVAAGNTECGYREWVEDRVEEAAHDRLVATKPAFEQCDECGEPMVPADFDFAPVGGDFLLPAGARNSDGELWVQCPNGHRGMWAKTK
jgi:hypothetical protein